MSELAASLPPGCTLHFETRPLLPARAGPPPPDQLTPEQIATLFRVPPWICANVGSDWGPLRRLAWRVRYWTWDL